MFKLFHPLEGTIISPRTVNSSCILISRHDHVLSFMYVQRLFAENVSNTGCQMMSVHGKWQLALSNI